MISLFYLLLFWWNLILVNNILVYLVIFHYSFDVFLFYVVVFCRISILFRVILSYFDIIFICEEAGPYCARRGAGTWIFGAYYKNTRIFTTDSTVPTSGIARRDPSRHVDVIIQILVKIRLMQPFFVKNLCFRRSTEELRPRERSHEFRAGRLV